MVLVMQDNLKKCSYLWYWFFESNFNNLNKFNKLQAIPIVKVI